MNYQQIVDKINNKEPFSLIRWGDGEWLSVFNTELNHYAADHTLYYPEIGEELRNILKSNPKYYMGMQKLGHDIFKDRIEKLLEEYGVEIDWMQADVFHTQSWVSELTGLFDALNANDVIMIGPERLRGINKLVHYKDYVEIPLTTAFLERDRIEKEVRDLLKDREHTVVLFAAASLSNVVIDRLYKDFGDKHTMIDIGSLFEPYVGLSTRQYHKDVLAKLGKGQ